MIKITQNIKFLLLIMVFLLLVPIIYAEDASTYDNITCIDFFYGNGCPHCAKVVPYIIETAKRDDLVVTIYEVYGNRTNALLINRYFEKNNISSNMRGVPAVFVSGECLTGDTPILYGLEALIEKHRGNCILSGQESNQSNSTGIIDGVEEQSMEALSIMTVIGAALVDSINPCAIAVLLILMSALLAAGDKKRAMKAGFAFTISIYIAYFLFGLGLYSAIQVSGLSYWFYKIVGFIAIIIGLFNIKDYFWYGGGGFAMEIPRRWRPTLKGLLKKITSPLGALLMGFVVTLFELPCTGGPYLFILGLLAQKTTQMQAIPILLLYNVFFVLPLIVITLLIYFGFTSVQSADKWKEKNIKVLHLIAGIVMLLLGLAVVLGFV